MDYKYSTNINVKKPKINVLIYNYPTIFDKS